MRQGEGLFYRIPHIDRAAVVKGRVQNRHRVIFRHIDLIKDAEAAVLRTLVNTPLSKGDLVIYKVSVPIRSPLFVFT